MQRRSDEDRCQAWEDQFLQQTRSGDSHRRGLARGNYEWGKLLGKAMRSPPLSHAQHAQRPIRRPQVAVGVDLRSWLQSLEGALVGLPV